MMNHIIEKVGTVLTHDENSIHSHDDKSTHHTNRESEKIIQEREASYHTKAIDEDARSIESTEAAEDTPSSQAKAAEPSSFMARRRSFMRRGSSTAKQEDSFVINRSDTEDTSLNSNGSHSSSMTSQSHSGLLSSPSKPPLGFGQMYQGVGFSELPRGGYIVRTRALGPIQFGIPPETIKDSLARGMTVPKHFVIQGEMFDRKAGLSKAEFEFPIYYQYFVARSRVNIITTKELEKRIRRALKETLIGPGSDCNPTEDYSASTPADALPNFEAEALSLDPERESTSLDDVVRFTLFDDANVEAIIEGDNGAIVKIRAYAAEDRLKGGTKPMFEVSENDQVLAHVPAHVKLRAGGTAGALLGNDFRESTRSKHFAKQQLKKTYEEQERQHSEAKPRASDLRKGGSSLGMSGSGVLAIPLGQSSGNESSIITTTTGTEPHRPAPLVTADSTPKLYEMVVPLSPMTPRAGVSYQQFPKFAPFDIPVFGITMMGASHGFDASGRTTGFVLWMNRRGIMVDPPPDSSQILELMGVPPLAIEGIILTHTHADHDAGTFQRILRTRQIKLYTTRTVERSFINKYAAITGFDATFLRSLFIYNPVQCGDSVGLKINGGELRFFYSLHTIPCVGIEAYFGSHSLVYSADTRYDPELAQRLFKEGKIGKRRAEQLGTFPYNHTIILHELGVPPIHTPKELLSKAAFEEKHYRKGRPLSTRLFVVHSSAGAGEGFANQCKDWDTIRIAAEQGRTKQVSEIISVLSNVEWLEPLGKESLTKLAKLCKFVTKEAREVVAQFTEGEPPESIFIVLAGIVSSSTDDSDMYTVGDCFGESGILSELEFWFNCGDQNIE